MLSTASIPAIEATRIGPGGRPGFLYVLYGLFINNMFWYMRFRAKSFKANFMVGSA